MSEIQDPNFRIRNMEFLKAEGMNDSDANTLAYYLEEKHYKVLIKEATVSVFLDGVQVDYELYDGTNNSKVIPKGLPVVVNP
jgi:hypothetical protein